MNFKQARKKLGMTQQELAKMLGLTIYHISRIENQKLAMKKQTALAMECLLRRKADENEL